MRDDSVRADSFSLPHTRTTLGESLPDGTIIEPVLSEGKLVLCRWDGTQQLTPYLDAGDVVYFPPKLEPSLCEAVRFPDPPSEYFSLKTLVDNVVDVFERHGFSKPAGPCCAAFALMSWLPELFFSPPPLIVHGSDVTQAAILLSILASMCRRPFFAPELSRKLPFRLQPTLLSLSTPISAKGNAFWRAVNHLGVRTPTTGGEVASLAGPKALFIGDEHTIASWGSDILHLPLFPGDQPLSPTRKQLEEISGEFQGKFLMFRFKRLVQENRTPSSWPVQKPGSCVPMRNQFAALVQGEPDLIDSFTAVVESQQRELLEYEEPNPDHAIIEVLWSPSHEIEEISIGEVQKRLNTLLRTRGEAVEFSSRGLGWKLRHLNLPRERKANGMVIRFSRDVRLQLHRLARTFKLELRNFADCPECK